MPCKMGGCPFSVLCALPCCIVPQRAGPHTLYVTLSTTHSFMHMQANATPHIAQPTIIWTKCEFVVLWIIYFFTLWLFGKSHCCMTFDLLALQQLMKGLRSLSPCCLFHISRDMKGKSVSLCLFTCSFMYTSHGGVTVRLSGLIYIGLMLKETELKRECIRVMYSLYQ